MSDHTEEKTTVNQPGTMEFPFKVRLGGSEYQLSIVPQFLPDDPRHGGDPLGNPGQYRVVITLGRPGFSVLPERQFVFNEQNRGDSHLAIAPPALQQAVQLKQIIANSGDGKLSLDCYPNERGFLGRIVAESISAKNVADAVSKATNAIAPMLSNLSAHFDIPLRVQQMEIIELRTEARHLIFVVAYNDAPFAPPNHIPLSDDFLLFVSYYREALGSNTAAYQFLCFYKIIEAIRKRRAREAEEAKTRGETVKTVLREVVPEEQQEFAPWLNALFPGSPAWDDLDFESIFLKEARGKKFYRIIDNDLRPLRDGIAHAVLDDEELVISADKSVSSHKLIQWLPLTKCMVRRMLKATFPQDFLASLTEDTS
jgi:hypothetical protein